MMYLLLGISQLFLDFTQFDVPFNALENIGCFVIPFSPLRDWRMAMSRFIIEFGDRLDGHF